MEEQDYSQWPQVHAFPNHNSYNTVYIRSNGTTQVVQKNIRFTPQTEWRARLEIKLMKQIKSPHVVSCLHSRQSPENHRLQIFMPYYSQGDLEHFLLHHPQLPLQERIALLLDILVGLKQLHCRFVIHRDLKLNNIFVEKVGEKVQAVVGDLGVAKVADKATSKVGTLGLQAPEVSQQEDYDNKVDMWGMGIIAYQLLNPIRNGLIPFPFTIEPESPLSKHPQRAFEVLAFDTGVPLDLAELVGLMLESDYRKRLSWVELYEGGVLSKYDEQHRVASFKADYKELESVCVRIARYVQEINQIESKYLEHLERLLRGERVLASEAQYPLLKSYKREVDVFYYMQLRTVVAHFEFIRSKNWEQLVVQLKPAISKARDALFETEDRINMWLRRNKEPNISINSKYLNQDYYQQAKAITDQVLSSVSK